MSANKVRYPGPGCLVEYMHGNSPVQAVVLEEQGGRLRLYGINHRESSLPAGRLLPWTGPAIGGGSVPLSRARMDEALEHHRALRATIASEVSAMEVWELTQGEVGKTSAEWLAGLVWEQPGVDHEAALGHVLLTAKTHFRFSPPDFEIFPEEVVQARLEEAEHARLREAFAVTGAQFFHNLWDIHTKKRGPLSPQEEPDEELASKLRQMLLERIADPDSTDDAPVWKLLIKGLPEQPHMPLNLAVAWGLVPEHYNFWLDRAGFERGESWAEVFGAETDTLRNKLASLLTTLPRNDKAFVSVDPAQTTDRDDAFFVQPLPEGGYEAHIALACPACVWPFGGPLDKAAFRRTSSLYLPEGDEHMLPTAVGRELFSLDAGKDRPALVVRIRIAEDGNILTTEPGLYLVSLPANLDLESCEALLQQTEEGKSAGNAPPHAAMLGAALALSRLLQTRRIADGAVITERPDPEIRLEGTAGETRVFIGDGTEAPLSHFVVGELMVLCNGAVATWAVEKGIPLLYRAQDVALPREFAGIWTEPHDISRVVRALPPASLNTAPKKHAGLGLSAYTNVTSPIRRYTDLLNQGQVVHYLENGAPLLDAAELHSMLPLLSARMEAVTQAQRLRPRYWKLLFFKQRGDKQWWEAVVADENDAFVTVALPWAQLIVRGRRRQFGEKAYPGQQIQVRLGKVNPLLNEIQVLEVREA